MKYVYGVGVLILTLIIIFFILNPRHFAERTPMNMNHNFALLSPVFKEGETIPAKYTCDGENVSPPLSISGVPEGTMSLVLVMDDPDIPQAFKDARNIDSFDHFVMYAIPTDTREIPERSVPGVPGLNGAGNAVYTGPCPPPEYEPTTHRYIFRLFALSGTLQFVKAPTKAEVLAALEPMVIAETRLTGVYDRSIR